MTGQTNSPLAGRRRAGPVVGAVLFLLLALAGWRGWVTWQAREARSQAAAAQSEQRLAALEQRIEALRRDQRAQTQRILDAAATNRVLRDEVLGLSQRGALLEESVSRLADPTRHGAQALRLDEVELLLSQAQQRLAIADDLDGAKRAYALASGALQGVDDPRLLNLRQALAQERSALDSLGAGPHAGIDRRLDAFVASLSKLPEKATADTSPARPAWQRMLAPLVDVRPTRSSADATPPSERATGQAALQIEIGLVRAALERHDENGFRAGIGRIDAWLSRLWPDSPDLRKSRAELKSLRAAALQADLPVLGSTLVQLRQLRDAGVSIALPATAKAPRQGMEP